MDLKNVMKIMRRQNCSHRRIAAIGMFDGVHWGHRMLIDFLVEQGQKRSLVPTVVTFAEHPLAKVRPEDCPPLINTVDQKMDLLRKAGIKDCVLLPFSDSLRRTSARNFLRRLKKTYAVDALVIGFNHSFGHDRLNGLEAYRAIGQEVGIEVIEAPRCVGHSSHPVSSSFVRRCITSGDLRLANETLGHPYSFAGRVVEGNRVGRTMGFPTANVAPLEKWQMLPPTGVFAGYVVTESDSRLKCMINVGRRPTVDAPDAPVTVEAHIFDYLGYLYGQKVEIEFIAKLREERHFSSLDKLKAQLAADEGNARKILATIES